MPRPRHLQVSPKVAQFFKQEPSWVIRDGLLALIIGALLLWSQNAIDNREANLSQKAEEHRTELAQKADQQRAKLAQDAEESRAVHAEQLENLRYLREQVANGHALMFAGLDLRNADLEAMDLSDANLRNADLRNVDFTGANLDHAQLGLADLRGAWIGHTSFRGANLEGADLRKVTSQPPDTGEGDGPDFSGAVLNFAQADGSTFVGARLYNVDLADVSDGVKAAAGNFCWDKRTLWPEDAAARKVRKEGSGDWCTTEHYETGFFVGVE